MDTVVLTSVPQPAIAELIVGLLKSEGIPAYSDGETLQDAFAVSQRTFGIRIFVTEDRLEEANRVLEEARKRAHVEELE